MAGDKLTPIEEALVRALTRAIVKELKDDATRIAFSRQLDAIAQQHARKKPKRKRSRKTKGGRRG